MFDPNLVNRKTGFMHGMSVRFWLNHMLSDPFLRRDGIHFSSKGSKIVVEEILRVLKEADWEPNLYWKSMPTEFGED